MKIEPFEVRIPQAVLDDLRDRLARTHWPDEVPGTGWEYGADLSFMQELIGWWRDGFDWRAEEARLNRFHHFRAEIGALRRLGGAGAAARRGAERL